MKRKLFVSLIIVNLNCLALTVIKDNICNLNHKFSTDFNELFRDSTYVDEVYEFVLYDHGAKRLILDAYGFKTKINKVSNCSYSFYLSTFVKTDINALKYDLVLNSDYFTIQLDTSLNPYKNFNNYNLDDIRNSLRSKQNKIEEGEKISLEDEYLLLFKAGLSGDLDAIELFKGMKKQFESLYLGHGYHSLQKVLVDHGYLRFDTTSINEPKIFARKYSYKL